MAIAGDLKVSATLGPYHTHPLRRSLPSPSSKVNLSSFQIGGPKPSDCAAKWPSVALEIHHTRGPPKLYSGLTSDFNLSPKSVTQEAETFLLNAINMSFLERLNLAWKIIFPSRTTRKNSNARIAKQRLKMILFSDRCAVSDEAKQKIVTNIVHALSDFVEIESQDKVQLTVCTDTDLGTIYSVTVPVRRVKPAYLDSEEIGSITNIEYLDNGERSGSVDVRFDFFVPDDNTPAF
ncbi:cell division topological specificity factor homolog, chloroplastic [Punica granatum]|uniref:Uncharacterized protein n=2 Tax=Punica granatum TaxID=22663 RepID=A0A2I0L4E9_PUNGR|nr:cell division topological specificity factor homolog, chloroplastic [Punica granatum]PKI75510.1 hypothetical protein CRG98_004180 [Punica granatum]